MTAQIGHGGVSGFEMRPDHTWIGDDMIVGSTRWFDRSGVRQERYHVLSIRDGKIADMQVSPTRRQAMRFARRRSR